jgi:glycosyltransferase involved in cell wall biosynthesis
LRLLHVAGTIEPTSGGPAVAVGRLAVVHRIRGHRAEVATFDPPGSPWLRDFPLPVYARSWALPGPDRPRGFAAWLRERCRDFDLVIVHGMRGGHLRATWRALYGTLTPYLVVPHGELQGWPPLRAVRAALGWPCALRDATGVLFTAAGERERAERSSLLPLGKSQELAEWTAEAFVAALDRFGYRG